MMSLESLATSKSFLNTVKTPNSLWARIFAILAVLVFVLV